MNDNDRIDETIRNAAADYNRPAATPKDEMWNAILAAKANGGPRLHLAAVGAPSSASNDGYSASKRFARRFAFMGIAAAAVLLLATGVGIGRLTNRSGTTSDQRNPRATVAAAPSITSPAAADQRDPAPTAATVTLLPEKSFKVEGSQTAGSRSREQILRNPRIIGSGRLNRLATSAFADTSPAGLGSSPVNTTYQVATQRHLADAEALLTSFSVGSRDESMDAQFAGWARGLLSNTRLLLDSPAGDDPRRAQLLQDLELVLAQIVQLSPAARAEDRELVQGSIQTGHVMTRLRTAIPAGQPREITER